MSGSISISERWILTSRLLFAASIPLLAWAFGVFFLLVPTQTEDLLADPTLTQIIAYHVGVAFWAASCWYWARWTLNLQPVIWPERLTPERVAKEAHTFSPQGVLAPCQRIERPGRTLRKWIARIPLLSYWLVALIPIIRTKDPIQQIMHHAPAILLVTVLLLFLADRHKRGRNAGSEDCKLAEQQPFLECCERLPFGRWSHLVWTGGFGLLCFLVWRFPVSFPAYWERLPSPSSASLRRPG